MADLLIMQNKLPFVPPSQKKNKNQGMMRRNYDGFGSVVDGWCSLIIRLIHIVRLNVTWYPEMMDYLA